MKAGGAWFLNEKYYITPGPIEWTPVEGGFN